MLHTSDRRLRGVRIAVSVYAVTLQLSLWTVTRIVINVFMCKQLVIILTLHCYYCQGSGPETFPAYLWSALSPSVTIQIETKHMQSCCQTLSSMPMLITIYVQLETYDEYDALISSLLLLLSS